MAGPPAFVALHGSWSTRWYGTMTINWTDGLGAHSVSIVSPQALSHISLAAVDIGGYGTLISDLGYPAFATILQTAMMAASAHIVSVVYNKDGSTQSYPQYVISCSSAATITFVGTAGTKMRRCLGFTGNPATAVTITSDKIPEFVVVPRNIGRTAYEQPAVNEGIVKSARTGLTLNSIGPAVKTHISTWDHRFETKEKMFRRSAVADTVVNGAHYTWEQLYDDMGGHAQSIVYRGYDGSSLLETGQVFQLAVPSWSRSQFRRQQIDMDRIQHVRIDAHVIGYT